MRRLLQRLALVTLVGAIALAGAFALWLRSEDARRRLERVVSEALDREVRIREMEVGWGSLTLYGLTVADPWSEEPALTVEQGRFEVDPAALLVGDLTGTLEAETFSLDVRKRGNETNFHGIRRPQPSGRALDLSLELVGGDVRLHDEDRHETVTLERVSLAGRVQRADAQRAVTLDAAAESVRTRGASVRDVSVVLGLDADGVELRALRLRLGGGRIEGEGHLRFDADGTWAVTLEARDVDLRDGLLPVLVAVFPAAVGIQDAPERDVVGSISLRAEVGGAGPSMQRLEGHASVWLDDLVLPRETALVRIAALLGRPPEPLAFEALEIDARLRGPWIRVEGLRSGGESVPLPFEGQVALDGRLDLEVDVLPLLRVVPGAHDWVRRYARSVPVRLEGTTREPVIRPPSASAVTKALAGAWVDRVLE